ncbi:MAG TPA: TIGR03118 family protein [Gaiellaceae bacterium]|nr:TIGR03118 family protein [Gaiellaceae bacterium]
MLALVAGAALAVVAPLSAAKPTEFTVTPLVSDQPGVAPVTDSDLVNPWGLVSGPTTFWWASDNGMDKSTLYNGSGTKQGLVVSVPGGPTGTVFNSTTGFVLPTGGKALFLFDGEDGIVRAWNGAQGTTAIVVKNRSDVGAIYKGLAIADTANGPRLYAADFHNGRIDVLDGSFGLVPNSGFEDPSLPKGFAPFNVQVLGNRVFVAYAKQDADAEDEVAGQGLGRVDVYDLEGNLLGGIDGHGQLNAPWGLAIAPASFGALAGDLLVGNFGDGQINAFREANPGQFVHVGELRGSDSRPLVIDGLWALQVSQGGNNGTAGQLFFTAGPDGESHGLFGKIAPN